MENPISPSVTPSGGRSPSRFFLAALAASSLLLASCSSGSGPAVDGGGNPDSRTAVESRTASMGSTVAVDYVLRLGDGTVFDTTLASEASGSAKRDAKRKYGPLLVVLGEGTMPAGFEEAVVGMSVGERKVFSVTPEKGYGVSAGTEVRMAKRLLEDSYAETVSADKYRDSFETVVPDNAFAESGKPLPKAGDRISSGGAESEVLKVQGGLVTLRVENRNNPFYGKKLAVGLVWKDGGNEVKITGIEGGNVTVEVRNASNPFKGKKPEPGVSAMIGGELHTVKKVEGDAVVLAKGHELAGKTLEYEVWLREVK